MGAGSVKASMPRSQTVSAVLLVIVALGLLYYSVQSSTVTDEATPKLTALSANKEASAPDWAIRDAFTGKTVRLSEETRLHPVVFSFWATWCGPCREELPHLERVSEKYRDRVAFYGINSNDPPQVMTAFAGRNKLTFPMLSDDRHEVAARYGADAIPKLVVVDTHGKVRAVTSGYDPNEDFETSLSKILDTLLAMPK